jgi:lipoprotein NlpI
MKRFVLLASLLLAPFAPAGAAADLAADALKQATEAWNKEDRTNAVEVLTQALKAKPKEARLWHLRAQMRNMLGQREAAVSDLDEAIKLEPDSAVLRQERATQLFRLGRIPECVVDFDKVNELAPSRAANNWQRGIALYYAGRFADGRRQFELHQTVNSEDVENAVWHFLCTAREQGLEAARTKLISISGDTRVPMKEVQALFANRAKPEDVMAAAKAGEPSEETLKGQLFYGNLYLGLYYEALGDAAKSREYIVEAAKLADPRDYMGDVARVHARRLLTPAPTEPKK